MKATKILTSLLFIVALLGGCSDNPVITDPFGNESANAKGPGDDNSYSVVCEFNELRVQASSEYVAENKAVYTSPPFEMISSYRVTFDVFTDADKLTNGFIPIVQIFLDKECVFESSEYPSADGQVTKSEVVALENVRFTDLAIIVTLMQGDGPVVRDEDQLTTLRLSKISISKED